MIDTYLQELPHGITLSIRATGVRGQPVLVFLHGFPEAAFIWDSFLEHFAAQGLRCIAPNLRGFERSSQPTGLDAYRPRAISQDIAALIASEGAPVEMLVAHDWGGAVAWLLANAMPQLVKRLAIVNSPHAGTFLRELKNNPAQREASAYMNFLAHPDAERLLAANDYVRLFSFFTKGGDAPWLTDSVKQQYRDAWRNGLTGGCNYYRASPMRPPRGDDPGVDAVELPRSMLTVDIPTLVVWGMRDVALLPQLLDGLEEFVPRVTIDRVADASHWIVHEKPEWVMRRLADFVG